MVSFFKTVNTRMESANQQFADLFDKLFNPTKPGVVFSEPVQAGDFTVITTSEVSAGGMYLAGIGGGISREQEENREGQTVQSAGGEGAEEDKSPGEGGGAGVSGGGWSGARPVAAIVIGPQGVQVQPVVDATKIALAFFTAMGAMFMMRRRMFRHYRKMWKAMK